MYVYVCIWLCFHSQERTVVKEQKPQASKSTESCGVPTIPNENSHETQRKPRYDADAKKNLQEHLANMKARFGEESLQKAPLMLGDDSLHQVELREQAKQEMNREYREHVVTLYNRSRDVIVL